MVHEYIRLFKGLNPIQHVVIFLTTFAAPVSFELVQGMLATGLCLSCVNAGKLALYFAWYQIAMVVIALSTRADTTKLEAKLTRISSELVDRVHQHEEENRRKFTGIQDRTGDLEWWVSALRSSIEEQLGIKLPGRRISARADPITVKVSFSNAEGTVGRSPYMMVRLRSWVKRQAVRFWRWSLKWVWDLKHDQTNRRH